MARSPWIALDTEFLSQRSYRPRLCLIQIALADGGSALIDPLAPSLDMAALHAHINNPNILKIMHAGKQDMAILYHINGVPARPVFDTQIAAMMCGMGQDLSLKALVHKVTGKVIDKADQQSDWSQRPLKKRQMVYALNDVLYLPPVYTALRRRLEESGRLQWLEEECANVLGTPENYTIAPQDAWKRLRLSGAIIARCQPRQWTLITDLAAWREAVAANRNIARGHILHDDDLLAIAAKPQQLKTILCPPHPEMTPRRGRGHSGKDSGDHRRRESRNHHAAIQDVIDASAKKEPLPVPAKMAQGAEHDAMVALFQALLQIRCTQHHITRGLVANRKDLESLARGDNDTPVLHGWRRHIFGADALRIRNGEIALSIRHQKMTVIETKNPPAAPRQNRSRPPQEKSGKQ